MIKLNKLAKDLWKVSENNSDRMNVSITSLLFKISKAWRKLFDEHRFEKGKINYKGMPKTFYDEYGDKTEPVMDKGYKEIELFTADVILDSINLLTLVNCHDIENLIRFRLNQRERDKGIK